MSQWKFNKNRERIPEVFSEHQCTLNSQNILRNKKVVDIIFTHYKIHLKAIINKILCTPKTHTYRSLEMNNETRKKFIYM